MKIELLKENYLIPVIITRENSKNVLSRAKKLKNRYNLEYKNIAYIGDDINDLPVIKKSRTKFCSK